MSDGIYRCAALSAVKHDYLPRAVHAHPCFELAVVADDPGVPQWAHERNAQFAAEFGVPYVRDVASAIAEHGVQVAVVSSEAERHCDLSVRAAAAGLHVIQDKPMSTELAECDRLLAAVRAAGVCFLLWNRNRLPALIQAQEELRRGAIGELRAIHVDFYFAKDAGPPKGSRQPGYPPIDWLARQLEAHADGSDGGVGRTPMGELQIEGIYPLGYIHELTGSRVRRVFARTAAHFHQANADNDVDDLATVTLEMENGMLGSLCIGRIGAASHPEIGEIKLHLVGSNGALVITEARPEVGIHYRGQPPAEYRNVRVADSNNFLLMENFKAAMETGAGTVLDAQAGRDITAAVAAAIESGRTGRAVDVA